MGDEIKGHIKRVCGRAHVLHSCSLDSFGSEKIAHQETHCQF